MQDCWLEDRQIHGKGRQYQELRLYSKHSERLCLCFSPCYIDRDADDISWEDWHRYKQPLMVFVTDYRKLLIPYLKSVFPVNDPTNNEVQEFFDECWDNWLGEDAWHIIIGKIESDFLNFSEDERRFYTEFIDWVKKALTATPVIVIEGNL